MTNRKFVLLVGVLSTLLLALFYVLLGEAARLEFLAGAKTFVVWVWGILILFLLFAFPWILGGLTRNPLMEWFDEYFDKGLWLRSHQHLILGGIASGFIGLIQTQVAMKAPIVSSWVDAAYRVVGWSGAWEVTPLWWMVYGFIAAGIAYWFVNEQN